METLKCTGIAARCRAFRRRGVRSRFSQSSLACNVHIHSDVEFRARHAVGLTEAVAQGVDWNVVEGRSNEFESPSGEAGGSTPGVVWTVGEGVSVAAIVGPVGDRLRTAEGTRVRSRVGLLHDSMELMVARSTHCSSSFCFLGQKGGRAQ